MIVRKMVKANTNKRDIKLVNPKQRRRREESRDREKMENVGQVDLRDGKHLREQKQPMRNEN